MHNKENTAQQVPTNVHQHYRDITCCHINFVSGLPDL